MEALIDMQKKIFAVIFVMFIVFSAKSFAGTTWTFPSGSCTTTLQACINAATSGDTILIAAAKVDENLTINKTLTLMPKPPNITAVIGGGVNARKITVKPGPNSATVHPKLIQLTLTNTNLV